jgi:hypothetical protein
MKSGEAPKVRPIPAWGIAPGAWVPKQIALQGRPIAMVPAPGGRRGFADLIAPSGLFDLPKSTTLGGAQGWYGAPLWGWESYQILNVTP